MNNSGNSVVLDDDMKPARNPIEAVLDSVEPYVITGAADSALARWQGDEPDLSSIGKFADLRAELRHAVRSDRPNQILEAMLRRYEPGDAFACLVVLEAFGPALNRAAMMLRFETPHGLEWCATRLLEAFHESAHQREARPVAGALLVARAKCRASGRLELRNPVIEGEPAAGRLDPLRRLFGDVAAFGRLAADIVGAALRQLGRARRERAARSGPWRVVSGHLCHYGRPGIRPSRALLDWAEPSPSVPTHGIFGIGGQALPPFRPDPSSFAGESPRKSRPAVVSSPGPGAQPSTGRRELEEAAREAAESAGRGKAAAGVVYEWVG